ncbi:MAG: hypothetical protein NZ772_11050 [Cyanobacteria bacterium]|nr:hypothetical protein [Cyanobacteriota bacterium]MDW8201993.1 hypothetical protein [Cyanobacteriota bacterium SKYGB_h_bin112]
MMNSPNVTHPSVDDQQVESFVQFVRSDHSGICQMLTALSIYGATSTDQAVITAGVSRLRELGETSLANWLVDMLCISLDGFRARP